MNETKIIRNIVGEFFDKIENLSTTEFIQFAKKYNIFQESNSKLYDDICNRIKARLDREGLSHETVRPE